MVNSASKLLTYRRSRTTQPIEILDIELTAQNVYLEKHHKQ